MKNSIYRIVVFLICAPAFFSCDKGFEELNTDPINILETTSDKLLAPALVNSLWPAMSRNRSLNNELMQVTVNLSDGDNTVFRYAFRATLSDYLWNAWYVQLRNFKDVDSLASKGDSTNNSYKGISRICQAWLFSNLTDIYGDVPYSQALQGWQDGSQGNVQPAFDKQKDIYLDLFKKLEEANMLLSEGKPIVVSSDPVYEGDISKWRKFGNALYLRLLLRISGKEEVAADCISKIKEIVENPAGYPIMTSNDDCATIRWSGGTSTTDPYTSPYVNGIRAQDFRSPAICKFFIDHLVAWNDPRLTPSGTYGNGGVGRLGIAQGSTGYSGVESGYEVGKGEPKQSYFYSNDHATYGGAKSLQQGPLTGIIMNFAEVQFILAEAAAKGWIDGDAETYFRSGIASAINYWVPTFPEGTTSSNLNTYLTEGDIRWEDANTLEERMEIIHLHKYYALFLVGMEQWFEYRRTGHPVLPKGKGLMNNGVMPARLVYPVYVQSANPGNYQKAVASQGADRISTQVWWQKP